MADEVTLIKHMAELKKAVKKVSDSVNRCGVDWNDAQFYSLSTSIKNVASSSKQILIVGNRCISAVKRFNTIESEK